MFCFDGRLAWAFSFSFLIPLCCSFLGQVAVCGGFLISSLAVLVLSRVVLRIFYRALGCIQTRLDFECYVVPWTLLFFLIIPWILFLVSYPRPYQKRGI
jgi:hypothetical protein